MPWECCTFTALVALIAVAGAVRGVADCANSVLVPGTAGLAGMPLERATGLFSTANNVGLLIGMPVAAALAAAFGSPTVVLIDGLSFAAAVPLIALLVPKSAQPRHDADRPLTVRGYGADLREGLAFIRGDRLLLAIVTMVACTNLIEQGLAVVLLPVWVRDHLGGPGGFGLLVAAMGAGAVVGALGGSWLGPRLPRWRTYSWGFLLGGACRYVVLALCVTLPAPVVVFALAGVAGGTINPILGAVQYERIPPRLQARVLGAVKASAWLGIPFGSLLAGLAVDGVGLRPTLWTAGSLIFLATLAPFVFPAWRGMNRTPATAPVHENLVAPLPMQQPPPGAMVDQIP